MMNQIIGPERQRGILIPYVANIAMTSEDMIFYNSGTLRLTFLQKLMKQIIHLPYLLPKG